MNDAIMTAKEYLSQAYRLDQRINSKLTQVARLRSLSQRVTIGFGSEPVSHTRNVTSLQDTIHRLMEAEEEVNRVIDSFVDTKRDIQQTIDLVSAEDCRLLLELRYLCMKRWEDIAGEMRISRTYANQLHARALEMVDVILRTRRTLGHAESRLA